jgi:hypothetical protein
MRRRRVLICSPRSGQRPPQDEDITMVLLERIVEIHPAA